MAFEAPGPLEIPMGNVTVLGVTTPLNLRVEVKDGLTLVDAHAC